MSRTPAPVNHTCTGPIEHNQNRHSLGSRLLPASPQAGKEQLNWVGLAGSRQMLLVFCYWQELLSNYAGL